jgi:hypothetical protein
MATRGVSSSVLVKRGVSGTGRRSARAKPAVVADANALLKWFEMFDARMADLATRQQALLRDLGVDPVVHPASPEQTREFV